MISCLVCQRPVPKNQLTEMAIKRGRGLCSRKCSKALFKTHGSPIPNELGKMQFKRKDDEKRYYPVELRKSDGSPERIFSP